MSVKVTLLKEGILVINYGDDCHYINYKKTHRLLDLAHEEVFDILPHIEKLPLLILAKNMKGMSSNAINLIHGKKIDSIINASTYLSEEISDSIIKRTIIRVYLWTQKPPYPFVISGSREAAIEWLKPRVPDNFTEDDYQTYLQHKKSKLISKAS